MFAGNFEPVGWKFCHGQLLSISEYDALFSILGTTYGGNGRTTFALPDLQGRVPLGSGQGPGPSNYSLGQKVGAETIAITANTMPSHSHELNATSAAADSEDPTEKVLAVADNAIYQSATNLVAMNSASIGDNSASGEAHENIQPFLCLNFIIATVGVYPSRN